MVHGLVLYRAFEGTIVNCICTPPLLTPNTTPAGQVSMRPQQPRSAAAHDKSDRLLLNAYQSVLAELLSCIFLVCMCMRGANAIRVRYEASDELVYMCLCL